MKRIIFPIALMVVTAITTLILVDFLREEPQAKGVIEDRLFSRILNEDREIIVHLPFNYDSTLQYPVIYVLDGSSEDAHVAEKFTTLSSAGYAPKTIVVGIPNMSSENRERNLTPPFMRTKVDDVNSSLGEGDKFLSFLELELFPFIEKNYGAAKVRLLHGHSRGGLLVMYSLLYKPEMFQARFCYSAPFWRQENILINKVSEYLTTQDSLKTFLFMSAGENETQNIKGGLKDMEEVFRKNSQTRLVWYSVLTPDSDHQNNSQNSAAEGIGRWCEYINGDAGQGN